MALKKKPAVKSRTWNKGLEAGQKDAFTPAQVKRIRHALADRGVPGIRDLALFSLAIDTKPPIRCALSKATAKALEKWIAMSEKKRTDYIFPGRGAGRPRPMTARQMSRLLNFWVAEAGLDPKKYGKESLRRTKALHILNGTGDLETVRMLLGHAKIESTANYLRIAKKSDPIAICRAFDI
jgi:integrase